MNPTKTAKCPCIYCSQNIEFDSDHAGETIPCPHCGMETTLYRAPEPEPIQAKPSRKFKIHLKQLAAIAGFLFLTVIAVGMGIILAKYPQLFSEAGNIVIGLIALSVIAFLVVLVFLWIIFPVFVHQKLSETNKLLETIEKNTRK